MARALLFLLLLTASVQADQRLGALIRAYLGENESVTRREELLAEIRRLTGDDPERVAAVIRAGGHRRYPAEPVLQRDGALPDLDPKRRNFRYDRVAAAFEASAAQFAKLRLPSGYDRTKRYPLVVDIGHEPPEGVADAVQVKVRPSRHPQANSQAVAAERLVLGTIAHVMSLVPIDPDRVFLRGRGEGPRNAKRAYNVLASYIAFQNPDRFAGVFTGEALWESAPVQGVHGELFSVFALRPSNGAAELQRAMRELGRFSRRHVMLRKPDGGLELRAYRERGLEWVRTNKRSEPLRRHIVVGVRPYPVRCHWLRLVPKTRSRRESEIDKTWHHWTLPQPDRRAAVLQATLDNRVPNLVHVKATNLIGFQIFVDPKVFDVTKPMRVSVNGKAPTAHLITPDIGVLLDDYRERADPGLLYVDRINVSVR
ncbi:MAG: hypothetical protein AAGD14_16360 [Planctomycetota bacterium]